MTIIVRKPLNRCLLQRPAHVPVGLTFAVGEDVIAVQVTWMTAQVLSEGAVQRNPTTLVALRVSTTP